jgi:hypothetical protein
MYAIWCYIKNALLSSNAFFADVGGLVQRLQFILLEHEYVIIFPGSPTEYENGFPSNTEVG